MNIYYIVLLTTAALALVFRRQKKAFVVSTAMVHIFVCGFRYIHMHGDLIMYHASFIKMDQYGWLSKEVLQEGRNSLFFLLNKFVSSCLHQDFQVLLFIIASISTIAISIVIYKYSPKPFVSFAMWSCFGFYMFSFFSIKQTLAMAFVMFATDALLENRRLAFYVFTIIAGFTHFPAFVFLPAYELCSAKKVRTVVLIYCVAFVAVFLFRNQIVDIMSDMYYESEKFSEVAIGTIGGKTIMMLAILGVSSLLCDLRKEQVRKVFILVSVASLLQMFSVYDNVFTRLSDYYFQFIILLAPYMLEQVHGEHHYPIFYFTKDNRKILTVAFMCLALLFYYRTGFSGTDVPSSDNLVKNFAFMWQVK